MEVDLKPPASAPQQYPFPSLGQAWRHVRGHLLVLALYVLWTIIATYPVAFTIGTRTPSDGGDAFQFIFDLWWFHHAFQAHLAPLALPLLFYPQPQVHYVWSSFDNELLGLLLQEWWSAPVIYSWIFLASFICGAFSAYWLCYRLVGQRLAAFAGGICFSFCLYHMGQAIGHIGILTIEWLPLWLLALLRWYESPTWKTGTVLGLLTTLVLGSDPYYLASFVLPASVTFVCWTLLREPRRWARPMLWLWGGLALLVAGALVTPFYLPLLQLQGQSAESLQSYSNSVEIFAPDLLFFFLPSPKHPLWYHPDWKYSIEFAIYLGLSCLAVLGLALGRPALRRSLSVWWWLGGVAFVLALGPHLHLAGARLPLPLPYTLYTHLPLLRNYRVPTRLDQFVMLCAAVIVSSTFADLFGTTRPRHESGLPRLALPEIAGPRQRPAAGQWGSRRLGAALLVLGWSILFTSESLFSFPYETRPLAISPVYQFLATQPAGPVLELPIISAAYNDYTLITHRHPIVYGAIPRITDDQLRYTATAPYLAVIADPQRFLKDGHGVLQDIFAAPSLPETLVRAGIRYVLYDGRMQQDQASTMQSRLTSWLGSPLNSDGQVTLYALPPTWPPSGESEALQLGEGWLEYADFYHGHPVRQTRSIATFTLQRRQAGMVRLVAAAFAYGQPRTVTVTRGKEVLGQWQVTPTAPVGTTVAGQLLESRPFLGAVGQSTYTITISGPCLAEQTFDYPGTRCLAVGWSKLGVT